MIDVVIVSNQKDEHLKKITEDAIESCIKTSDCHVYLVEANKDISYDLPKFITVLKQDNKGGFNYNKHLNAGARAGESEYIAFCNNDLIFHDGWADKLIEAMKRGDALSGSPYSAGWVKQRKLETSVGYEVGGHFAGWCFIMTRECYEKIGGLSEDYTYWCSDNIVVEQLKEHKINHVFCKESRVDHLLSKTGTHVELPIAMTWVQAKKFEQNKKIQLFHPSRYAQLGL